MKVGGKLRFAVTIGFPILHSNAIGLIGFAALLRDFPVCGEVTVRPPSISPAAFERCYFPGAGVATRAP